MIGLDSALDYLSALRKRPLLLDATAAPPPPPPLRPCALGGAASRAREVQAEERLSSEWLAADEAWCVDEQARRPDAGALLGRRTADLRDSGGLLARRFVRCCLDGARRRAPRLGESGAPPLFVAWRTHEEGLVPLTEWLRLLSDLEARQWGIALARLHAAADATGANVGDACDGLLAAASVAAFGGVDEPLRAPPHAGGGGQVCEAGDGDDGVGERRLAAVSEAVLEAYLGATGAQGRSVRQCDALALGRAARLVRAAGGCARSLASGIAGDITSVRAADVPAALCLPAAGGASRRQRLHALLVGRAALGCRAAQSPCRGRRRRAGRCRRGGRLRRGSPPPPPPPRHRLRPRPGRSDKPRVLLGVVMPPASCGRASRLAVAIRQVAALAERSGEAATDEMDGCDADEDGGLRGGQLMPRSRGGGGVKRR